MGKKAVVVLCATAAVVVAAGASVAVRSQMKKSGKWAKAMAIVKELEDNCATPISLLRSVADAMAAEMRAGLESEGGGQLKMLISYVDNLPTG